MAVFNFFKLPKHRTFNYKPRYYDPQKEELEERINAARENRDDIYVVGKHIRGKIQQSLYQGRKSSLSPAISRIIVLVTLIVLVAVIYFFTDALSYFFK